MAILPSFAAIALCQTTPLVNILAQELERNYRILREKGDPAPYYIAYAVTEQETAGISATLGALTTEQSGRRRVLQVTVRVGSPKLDNYHRIRGERAVFAATTALPLEESPQAIQRIVWLETDRAYRRAAERLLQIKTNREMSVAEADDSDDFSSEQPSTYFEPAARLEFSAAPWAARVRKLSRAFDKFPSLITSYVILAAEHDTKWLVDTEGTRLQQGHNIARITFGARSKAADGMDIAMGDNFDAPTAAALPADGEILKAIDRAGSLAEAMRFAPVIEPYAGPAILSGRASAVLFHEIFGHRIEGHRQKDETEDQTFTRRIGSRVLPPFISVIADPTRTKIGDVWLDGSYLYDDEGVKARSVTVVNQGVLEAFLMSRSPIRGFSHSNGHGRRQPGFEPVSRQSNLFVESSQLVPEAELRRMLIAEVRRQNKPYGLYFDQITGGFTLTSRAGPQAFKVIPLVVYRVYADGRKDELVRGADIVGTPLASFAKILATGGAPEVFNGVCGAESGSIPVAAVSPAILVSEIEIQKKPKSDERPPYLPPPLLGGGN